MSGFVAPIKKKTLENNYFRKVLFTAKHLQLVVMSLEPGEDIGEEIHPTVDHFYSIERGEATFILDGVKKHAVKDGDAIIVPAGTRHNVINTSKTARLKLYTIYSPPNHADMTVHKTKAESEAEEQDQH